MNVVIWLSKIDQNAREKPCSTAARGDLPARSSSRMRSLISTFASTAIPTVSAMPAMPGNVRVASKKARTARSNRMLRTTITSATRPATS